MVRQQQGVRKGGQPRAAALGPFGRRLRLHHHGRDRNLGVTNFLSTIGNDFHLERKTEKGSRAPLP